MKRCDVLLAAEVLLCVGAAALAWQLPFAPFKVSEVVWFSVGLIVLAFSDVWLPRGDTVGMSSALVLGATLLFDTRVVLMMLMVALAASAIPKRGTNWRRALASLSANAVAAALCSSLLVAVSLHPSGQLLARGGQSLQPVQQVWLIVIGVMFSMLEFGLLLIETAVRTERPVVAGLLSALSFGTWLIAAQASAGVLVSLMHRTMGPWGLAVAVVMILVMRQSFVLLLEIRQAYNSTIDVLVGAMEVQMPGREGLAERNAEIATAVGREIGLHGRELERLRYAALLAGLGAREAEEMDSLGQPESEQGRSATIIKDVEFLRDVVPVLQLCDNPSGSAECRRSDLTCAYIVTATASALDTARPGQMDGLSSRVGPRLRHEVASALDRICGPHESAAAEYDSQAVG